MPVCTASAVSVVRPSCAEKPARDHCRLRNAALPESAARASASGRRPNQLATSPARGAVISKLNSGPRSSEGNCSTPWMCARTLPERALKSIGTRSSSISGSSAPLRSCAVTGLPSSEPRISPLSALPAGSATDSFSSVKSTGRPPSMFPYERRPRSISSRTSRLRTNSLIWSPRAERRRSKRPSRPSTPGTPASSSARPPSSESRVPSARLKVGGEAVPSTCAMPSSLTPVTVPCIGDCSWPLSIFTRSETSRTSPGRLTQRSTRRVTSASARVSSVRVKLAFDNSR